MTARPDTDIIKARNGWGRWVQPQDCPPYINIAFIVCRYENGIIARWSPHLPWPVAAYFFPTMFAEVPRAGKRRATP